MIGVPMPDPRQAVIADLHRQMDAFFGSGKKAQIIPSGIGANTPIISANAHQEKLRAQRDRLTPMVRAQAEAGATAAEAAKATGMHVKRAKLIAQENGFKFADTP
ncbi:hypothetical protein [Pseudomonas sp. NFX5]|jgi:hypothetical protein|uniref:hypothetical protein n=1 Tax=Pseudomonas sp. NFX5 TaxID=2816961 RepID=UPI003B8C8492